MKQKPCKFKWLHSWSPWGKLDGTGVRYRICNKCGVSEQR